MGAHKGHRLVAALAALAMTMGLGIPATVAAADPAATTGAAQATTADARTARTADTQEDAHAAAPADDPSDTVTAQAPDGTAYITVSPATIGNVPDPGNSIVSIHIAANAGDRYVITIPASSPDNNSNGVYGIGAVPQMTSGGTVTSTSSAAGTTVTITFTADTSVTIPVTLDLRNNYFAQAVPMTILGNTTRTITWNRTLVGTDDPQRLPDLDFTQVVAPAMHPSDVTRVSPAADKASQINTHQNVTYMFQVREANGISSPTDYWTGRVNSSVNYGTTIRVPVPAHFTLDEQATMDKNAFGAGDKTTVTQPGGAGTPIIITVPKGSGTQNYQGGGTGYYFVGQYDTPQPDAETMVMADAGTIEQTLEHPDGTTSTLKATIPAWKDYLKSKEQQGLCTDNTQSCLGLSIAGNNTTNQILDSKADNLTTLNFGGFQNNSAADLTHSTLTFTMPDGFDANAIVTPKDPVNLPGLNTYDYTMTLEDGTVERGSVAAGATITRGKASPIATIELHPNLIAAGAKTQDAASCTSLTDDNAACAGRPMFYVQGTLAKTYRNGSAIKPGDRLNTVLTWTDTEALRKDPETGKYVQIVVIAQNVQTIINDDELTATLNVFGWENPSRQSPGSADSGYLSVYTSLDPATTSQIFEPIFYYVLPKYTVYNREVKMTVPNVNGDTTGDPKITATQLTDGREVVKLDYTGTGYWFNTRQGANQQIHPDILGDAVSGSYPWGIYLYSPKTKISGKGNAQTQPFSEEHDVYTVGTGTWTIAAAQQLLSVALAQGNEDAVYREHGWSNDKAATNDFSDPAAMNFEMAVNNGAQSDLNNVRVFANVPQSSDGSTIQVRMTGPVTAASLPGYAQ